MRMGLGKYLPESAVSERSLPREQTMTELSITPIFRDGVQTLVIEGDVDAACVDVLASALADPQLDVPVIADLGLLTFIDSSGLHALFTAAEKGTLGAIVRAPGSNISRVLNVVDANKIVPLFDDLAAAVAHIKASRPRTRTRLGRV
jgi:anti-anti-sigma regulatory factor